MDPILEKLKATINKLTEQQHQIEDKYIGVVSNLVKDLTQKGIDLPVLTGMLLNVDNIIQDSSSKVEAWQVAGQKFLFRAKNKYEKKKQANSKNQATQTVLPPETGKAII
ncbi:MAG: hypothetical protein FJX03_02875 [Alphaproteobacteria bacterium]|nr:hypothetical protein [Alphaproteobacteria bacterium]